MFLLNICLSLSRSQFAQHSSWSFVYAGGFTTWFHFGHIKGLYEPFWSSGTSRRAKPAGSAPYLEPTPGSIRDFA